MNPRTKRLTRFAALMGCVSALALVWAQGAVAQQPDRLLLEAKELIYNNDKNTVEAIGSVQLFYKGRTLEADRVVYNRATKRVEATGNARLTEANGAVVNADRFDLTDDFREGFVDSLRLQNIDRTRFSSPRAERSGGDTVTFETGTYTACAPCAADPERPPLWQVRARRIIHKGEEKTVYFESSTLEFYGVPIAYVPYFWAPDSTVRRQSGFLAPVLLSNTTLGFGGGIPYFWAIAPNYDLTLTPTYLSRQGPHGTVEWRHRLMNGAYTIRATGVFQQDPDAFRVSAKRPYATGDRNFRGSIESFGHFDINRQWRFGWDVSGATDADYFNDYRVRTGNLSAIYQRERTSQIYLNGQSANAYFDLRGYYFKPQYNYEWQKQQPIVHPVLDYDRRSEGPSFLGGEFRISANITALSREQAQFQPLLDANGVAPYANLDYVVKGLGAGSPVPPQYSRFETCTVVAQGRCILRGVGGFTSRASVEMGWRKRIIDPIGQVWTPFASLRADGFFSDFKTSGGENARLAGTTVRDESAARLTPTVGLDYRFPLLVGHGFGGSHIVTPVAQIIASPNEQRVGQVPNEDAQSLVFEDTNLFSANRFSGYDRIEGGTRINYGLMYNGRFGSTVTANALFGQSYHLGGRNSFATVDPYATGTQSGLDKRRSDYVARAQIAHASYGSLTARARFDERSFTAKALELSATAYLGRLSTTVSYARYEAQRERGQPLQREGVALSGNLNLTTNWRIFASAVYDLDRYRWDRIAVPTSNTPRWALAGLGVGVGYRDECTVFDVTYSSTPVDGLLGSVTRSANQTLLFRLELRTLGEVQHRQGLDVLGAGGVRP